MTVLSDVEIARAVHYGELGIDPYDETRLQPASYDVTLADEFIVFDPVRFVDESDPFNAVTKPTPVVDPLGGIDQLPDDAWEVVEADSITVDPGGFALGTTVQNVDIPADMTVSVEPRSSAARFGLVTDGWVDPGFPGDITIEISNTGPFPMEVRAGESYTQLVFERTGEPAGIPYDQMETAKYVDQDGVTGARSEE